ncbi:MAG TPA: phosphotransferase [Bryobacteraceae bacterium]|nr:phosphotransferase [Bryobacteraceae bacterium]
MIDIEDPAQLKAYLGPVTARVLRGGVSNKTVLIERENGEAWVLKQALPQLRVAVEWFCSPDRINREAKGLEVAGRYVTAPRLVFHDPANHLLAMEAVPPPHENWKTMLLRGELQEAYVIEFARMLRALHSAPFDPAFEDTSYFEALRLEPYYLYTAEQCPEAAEFLHDLVASTRATHRALVHGDYSPKNVLIHNDQLVLLDFEVMHWGDPAFDVGFALAHLISKAHYLRDRRFAEAASLFYSQFSSYPRAIHHALGCLLARVAGRSTLEYLTPGHRARQRQVVVRLMRNPPAAIEEVACSLL